MILEIWSNLCNTEMIINYHDFTKQIYIYIYVYIYKFLLAHWGKERKFTDELAEDFVDLVS